MRTWSEASVKKKIKKEKRNKNERSNYIFSNDKKLMIMVMRTLTTIDKSRESSRIKFNYYSPCVTVKFSIVLNKKLISQACIKR